MKKMFSYDDYMLEMIAEAAKDEELHLMISQKLRDILKSLNHPIAQAIIDNVDSHDNSYKVTYVDIDDSDPEKKDMVSFINSNKVLDLVAKDMGTKIDRKKEISDTELNTFKRDAYNKQYRFYDAKTRSKTKIGRLVVKLFPGTYKQSGDPGKDIESFVNRFKAARDTSKFEIVKEDDIKHWYNEKQYMQGGGQLNNSCMRYGSCEDYLELYSMNPDKVSLVILKDPEDDEKIRGRAILWELDYPSGRTFMDRIYTVNDSDILLFQDFAKENGWYHKVYQNMDEDGPWMDTKTGKEVYTSFQIDGLKDPGSGGYPYMDTMKYFDGDSISNDSGNVSSGYKKLEDTGGGYEEDGIWSDFYNENIDPDSDYMIHCDRVDDDGDAYRYEDDCYYSDFYSEYICNDYADSNMEELDHYDEHYDRYRDYGDYITTYEGNTCDERYAENNFSWSDYHDEWVEDAVWSEYHNTHIAEDDAVEVYTDVEAYDTDWRAGGDGSYWEWEHDGNDYDEDITEEELREHHDLDDDDEDEDDE